MNSLKQVVSPFVSSMLAGLEHNDALLVPSKMSHDIKDLYKKLITWQLKTSSLDYHFTPFLHDEEDGYPYRRTFHPRILNTTLNTGRPFSSHDVSDASFTTGTNLAICLSGGIDSTIAVLWAIYALRYGPEQLKLLTVDYGAPYTAKERRVVNKLIPILNSNIGKYRLNTYNASVGLSEPIDELEMGKGYIIPNRNAVIASFGSIMADETWIVANYRKIDDEPGAAMDKNRKFYWGLSHLLSRMYDVPKRVTSPFLHMTKTEAIKWLIDTFDAEYANTLLRATVTCYHPTEDVCGECFACFKAAKSLWEVQRDVPAVDIFDYKFNKFKGKCPKSMQEYISREVAKGRTPPSQGFLDFFGVAL